MNRKEEFIELLARNISEIPQDVKIMFEFVDDAEFDDDARRRAAQAIFYLLAPGDLVPDTHGLLGHVDDSLVLRMTMAHLMRKGRERFGHYRERYPEVFDSLESDLELVAGSLGDVYEWIEDWLDRLDLIEFKGKNAQMVLDDVEVSAWLYDEVNEALLDLEFDEDELHRELRKVDRIIGVMKAKMEASRR